MPVLVLPFQPKFCLGHPENYLFLLSKNLFTGSKYPKFDLLNFEKYFTGVGVSGAPLRAGSAVRNGSDSDAIYDLNRTRVPVILTESQRAWLSELTRPPHCLKWQRTGATGATRRHVMRQTPSLISRARDVQVSG